MSEQVKLPFVLEGNVITHLLSVRPNSSVTALGCPVQMAGVTVVRTVHDLSSLPPAEPETSMTLGMEENTGLKSTSFVPTGSSDGGIGITWTTTVPHWTSEYGLVDFGQPCVVVGRMKPPPEMFNNGKRARMRRLPRMMDDV